MPEQPLDLRYAVSALRRHRRTLIGAGLLGAVIGIAPVILSPPMFASSSLVLLPPKTTDPNQAAELVKTDLKVAVSGAVLGPAAKELQPPMTPEALAQHVDVTAVTPLVLEVRGLADDPIRAEQISRAVASSDVTYVTNAASFLPDSKRAALTARASELRGALDKTEKQIRETTARQQGEGSSSPRGSADATALAKLTAQQDNLVLQLNDLRTEMEAVQPTGAASIIQTASAAHRSGLIARYVWAALAGLTAAVLVAAAVVILRTRHDRRLRYRDDIADAVGSPVIASVRSRVTGSVAGWISLLHGYAPGTVDAWALRQALRYLTLLGFPAGTVRQRRGKDTMDHPRSITVITLSGDLQGLAGGPQMAAYATSAGVRTRLVAAQGHHEAASLWAALSSFEQGQESRPGLRVSHGPGDRNQADLDVVLVVVDRHEPSLPEIADGSVVILSLSAGSTTAVDLARVAVTLDDVDRRVQGIVVANPDSLDRTTGRLLQHERAERASLPTRVTGAPPSRPRRDEASTAKRRRG